LYTAFVMFVLPFGVIKNNNNDLDAPCGYDNGFKRSKVKVTRLKLVCSELRSLSACLVKLVSLSLSGE